MRGRGHGSAETCLSDDGCITPSEAGRRLAAPRRMLELIAAVMACQHDHLTSIAG